ncbi:MAG: helix-turn-helix domain-containing protein [Clostridiales bacterium]|nr:helix-turn-helix domain-containing protein [Clostridiales bacterium]
MLYGEIPLKTKKAMGRAYADMRREYGVSQEAVAEKLLTQRALSNFEQNGELPCWLVISALLRRVGKNADYFVPVLSKGEYEYLNWKNEMLLKLQKESVTAEDWESGMAKSEGIHPVLQRQFVTFWKGFLSDDISAMQRAVAMTVPGYPGVLSEKSCAGTEELAYLLICMERKLQLYPETWAEEKPMLESVLHYIETCYQKDEQVKIYYRAACIYGTYMIGADPCQKLVYYHKALDLHREMAILTGIEDVLRGIIMESENWA